jgi:hypothetical protein
VSALRTTTERKTGLAFRTLVGLFAVSLMAAAPDPLPRAAHLGVTAAPPAAGVSGVTVAQAAPDGSAAAFGVRPGDRIVAVNGVAVANAQDMAQQIGKLRQGASLRLDVVRDGANLTLSGRALPRPRESYAGAQVAYGAVPFEGGQLREILVRPTAAAPDGPVVYFIPGYTCSSVESPDPQAVYHQLFAALLARGITVYRVEKPLVGDSVGTPDCRTTDFDVELAAFEAGWKALTGKHAVHPDRVFLFGHSMGGIEAPMLASRAAIPPRGIAVYGIGLRNWADYMTAIYTFQGFEIAGADPAEAAARVEVLRPVAYDLHFTDKTIDQIAAGDPARTEALRSLGWRGGVDVLGRSYLFWRDLARLNLPQAWRDSKSEVLAVYGESDLVAYVQDDHRLIAEVANHYRPGTGRVVAVPETDHGMRRIGDRAEVRRRSRAGAGQPLPPYNPEIARIVGDWVEQSMRKPPVRTRSFPAPNPPQS